MSDAEKDDRSRFDQAREWVKGNPMTAGGAAIGAIGGVYGVGIGTAAGAAGDKARKKWQERQNKQDNS